MENAEEKINSICKESGISTPIEFLTKIMGGSDPRASSLVYLKILELEQTNGDEPPDEYEWLDLVEMIKQDYRHSIVDIGKSQDAAKQLMEYIHPKRKAIEKTTITKNVETSSLSRKEIKQLRKAFDLDF